MSKAIVLEHPKPYVVFREDNNTHREKYTCLNGFGTSFDVKKADRFSTARDAYAFGGLMGLSWWKVGRR